MQFRSVLASILLATTACDSNNGNDSVDPMVNIRVAAVDEEMEPVGIRTVVWAYEDGTGFFLNPIQISCDPDAPTKNCESLDIGFDAQGEIRVRGDSYLDRSSIVDFDPDCDYFMVGELLIEAIPSQYQELTLPLSEMLVSCPGSE